MSDIIESVVHYTYLLVFILMIFCIKNYYSKNESNSIYFIGFGLLIFVFSLFLLKVLNGFYLYNSIIHGLGISIAVVLLLNFIKNTENMNFDKPNINFNLFFISLMNSLKSPFSYLYSKLFNIKNQSKL